MVARAQIASLTPEERRARRAERRARQREANVGRAVKMRAARLAWESENPVEERKSESAKSQGAQIGCSGWFYWHWRGGFYEENSRTADWFAHYAKNFATVELNAPFYSWPTVATVQKWISQAGRKKFVYTVKVSELITHVRQFVGTKDLIKDFGFIADLLGPRMGCFLFQLPPSFHFTQARLKRILGQLDPSRKNVVEFRHRSWWNTDVFSAFRSSGAIFCSCSAPRLPEELVKTADDVYIRFHGIKQWYRHDYTLAELSAWAKKIKSSGAKGVWAYFNNDRDCYAIKNARSLRRLLRDPSKSSPVTI